MRRIDYRKSAEVRARIEPEIKEALDRAARKRRERLPVILREAVLEYVQRRGFLPPDSPPGDATLNDSL